jgi:hypothetical protein
VVAAAVHDGHLMRPEVAELSALSEDERLREEDPFTGAWTDIVASRIVGTHSRFEFDLNRPRSRAVYEVPDDAWGLHLWKQPLPAAAREESLTHYDRFYADCAARLDALVEEHGVFFVYDLHTYNHRRTGPEGPVADPEGNPEVNIGTGTLDREVWGPLIDRLIADLRGFDFLGRSLDVRENVKFQGGAFPMWIHGAYPRRGCAVAIEFKKFFMDEWSGELDVAQHRAIREALRSTLPGVLDSLRRLRPPTERAPVRSDAESSR